jgi:hypothetical protein
VALVLEHFSEKTREAIVEDSFIALDRFVGAECSHAEGSSTIVKYPSLGSRYALTGQRPMVAGALVSAFSWIFVTRSEREQVLETIEEDLLWRWFVIPPQQDPVVVVPRGYCPHFN